MLSLGRRHLLSLVVGGATVSSYVLYRGYESDFDIYNVGAARFGRAAVTVGAIGLDYKRTLRDFADEDSRRTDAYQQALSACHQRSADKLLQLCRDNGGCFVKVGQHIGALEYLLPQEFVNTLRVLHHKAPKMDLRDIYQVIREDLLQEPEELFSSFEEEPLGTASLAQVHRAVLRDSDDVVAVKVQHRYVKRHSFVDIHTMDFLVRTVKYFFPEFEFMWLADEMRKNLPLELSFTQEAKNAEMVGTLLQHLDWLRVPDIHWSLTTDRVLTMEYCSGGFINDIEYYRKHQINPFEVSSKISQMYADMIFKFGYVHCDPHPGNVLVKKEHGEAVIILLDHGLYTQLSHEFRLNYANFWMSILSADKEGIQKYADNLGVGQLYGLFACMVSGRSWASITKGIDRQKKNSAETDEIKANAQLYIRQIADVLAFVNRQMILIFKTNDLLRSIEHALGTSNSMSSLVQMSRACVRCLNNDSYRRCKGSTWRKYRVIITGCWRQFAISCYQVFLWLYWSNLGVLMRRSLVFSKNA